MDTTITFRARDSDGLDVVRKQTAPKPGYTVHTVPGAWPTGPGVDRWDAASNALIRYVAPVTPQQTFDAAVAAGYTVPGITPPLVLDLGADARAQFTGLTVLLDKLMSSGQLLATSMQTITGKDGVPRSLPVSQIDGIVLGYGVCYANLFNALHAATVAAGAQVT